MRHAAYGAIDGLSDIDVATSYRFLDEAKSGMDLSVMGSLNIPTADENKFGSGNWEPKLSVLMAKTFGRVTAVTNVGIRHIIDAAGNEEDVTLDASLEGILALTERFSLSGSLGTWTSRWKSSVDDAYYQVGTGVRFAPTQTTSLSLGVYKLVACDYYDNDWYVAMGMGIEF